MVCLNCGFHCLFAKHGMNIVSFGILGCYFTSQLAIFNGIRGKDTAVSPPAFTLSLCFGKVHLAKSQKV